MAEGSEYIAVFCAAQIPSNLVTRFLDEAYGASSLGITYALVTSDDPHASLEAARPPIEKPIKTTNIDTCGDAVTALKQFSGNHADPRYFVVLDQYSLEPDRGCLIGDTRSENYVRCSFGLSLLAVDALRSGSRKWPDLWLDAAVDGGVISEHRESHKSPSGRYQSIVDQEEMRQSIQALRQRELEEADQPCAVFCTADVPLATINELLTESESPEVMGLCILDTLQPDESTRTTTAPLDSFTSPFVGKSFPWILQFATNVLSSSPLSSEKFLVLDSNTLSHRSVLHVDTQGAWWDDTDADQMQRDLFAARESFETAYNSLLGEVGSMDEFAVEAATHGGVYTY